MLNLIETQLILIVFFGSLFCLLPPTLISEYYREIIFRDFFVVDSRKRKKLKFLYTLGKWSIYAIWLSIFYAFVYFVVN